MTMIPAGGWGWQPPRTPPVAVTDPTDEQRLTTPEPASEHARKLLIAHRRSVKRIVRVYPEAILFLDALGLPVTAWLWPSQTQTGTGTQISFESGFPAEPSY